MTGQNIDKEEKKEDQEILHNAIAEDTVKAIEETKKEFKDKRDKMYKHTWREFSKSEKQISKLQKENKKLKKENREFKRKLQKLAEIKPNLMISIGDLKKELKK